MKVLSEFVYFSWVWMRNVRDIIFCTILYYNSLYGELWLIRMCSHIIHWYTLTNHNLQCGQLWHKIMPKVTYVLPSITPVCTVLGPRGKLYWDSLIQRLCLTTLLVMIKIGGFGAIRKKTCFFLKLRKRVFSFLFFGL